MNRVAVEPAGRLLRCMAVAMFAVPCATVWYLLNTAVFPMLATATFAWAVWTPHRWQVNRSHRLRAAFALAVLFALKSRVAPVHVATGSMTSLTQLAHAAGQFLMVLQIVLVLTNQHARLLPQILPWLGILVLVCAGDLYVTEVQRSVFQAMVLLYVTLAAAYSAMNRVVYLGGRAARTVMLGLGMLCVALLGWWGSSILNRHQRDIEKLIAQLVDPRAQQQQVGFAMDGSLQSVVSFRNRDTDDIVMRIYADDAPGYVRGQVFSDYSSGKWATERGTRVVSPSVASWLTRHETEPVFALGLTGRDRRPRRAEFWMSADMQATLFLPDSTGWIAADVESLTLSTDDNVSAPDLPSGYPYTTFTSSQLTDRLTEAERQRYLRTGSIPEIAQKIAEDVVLPHARLSEKIAALTGYFDANHGYSLEFFAPIGHEPVDWFLRQKADAHCEYFATAGVMVLRAAGIPARYVTGFVVPEKSRYGDYWVVRNKYAHAWIQVWDDETGNWRTVDTTPAGGIPRASRPGRVAQLWNYLRDRYHVFRVRLHQRGLIWGLQLLLGNWLVRVLLGLGLTFGLLRLRRRTTAAVSATTRLPDETARQLQRLLHRMDRRLQRRHGLVRNRAETLHQFANRVAAAMPDSTLPDWYRQYAQARYAPGGDALLAQIRESAPRV